MKLAVLLFAVVFLGLPECVKADKVTDWNAIGVTSATNAGRGAPAIGIDMAYVHIAIYDAVNAIDGRCSIFAVSSSRRRAHSSKEAAVVAAAYYVLRMLHPTQIAYLDDQYATSMATIPDSRAKTDGIAIGFDVALQLLSSRTGDGRDSVIPYTPGTGPGVWNPTPPANSPAQFVWVAYMRPFAMRSASQFRPGPPPALNSQEWADDLNEVKTMGAVNSASRTPEQTEIARFYLDSPNVQAARGYRALALEQGMDLADNARLFAILYVSVADALIANFDSKYYYNSWRPVTAIRNADADDNSNTQADPAWLPLAPTPPFPEYLGAHSTLTSAYCEALVRFFGTKKIHFVLTSTTTGTTHEFNNTDDIVKEVNNARVWSGFHFRTSDVRGAALGKRVAKYVARNYFRRFDN
ncbi:MAG: vanadium-dependent haloperoxidase [Pyrinomonadaceae bacterium]